MTLQNNISANKHISRRSSLHSMIYEGLQHPLLVILAAPGYGKTLAMADYLEQCDGKILWLRLSIIDNLPIRFWEHLLREFIKNFPEYADSLQDLVFPTTIYSFDAFAQIIENNICGQNQVIWVFDDYGIINNPQVIDFIRMLVEADFENFHLVLLSNVLDNTKSLDFITTKRALLLGYNLRFNQNEIQQLYYLHGFKLEADELEAIEHYTEGWPLALSLLVLEHNRLSDFISNSRRMIHGVISHLFEECFFKTYSREIQILFVKLAMLDSFTKELAISLFNGNTVHLQLLDNHAFILPVPATKRLYLHHLYRIFLQEKTYLLTPSEEKIFWKKVAEYHMASKNMLEAVTCFRKCEDYSKMLEAINHYFIIKGDISGAVANYFVEHIELLTPEQKQDYPIADYLQAFSYLLMLRLKESERLLLNLEKQLHCKETPNKTNLLCNVYSMLGAIHMMRNQEDFGDYYKRAADYVVNPQESNKLFVMNAHNFSISNNEPGAKERMERAVHYGIPWITKVFYGGMSGMEYIFSAEAAYLSNKMDEAHQHAYRAIYIAKTHSQHDLVCNGYIILARISFMQGNFAEMTKQIEHVVEYANSYNIEVLKEIRDTALGWYYIKLHDYKKIPKNILDIMKIEMTMLTHCRPQIVYANYLINKNEYAQVVGLLEQPVGLYLSNGIWPDRICVFIMLAISYNCLGNNEAAMKTFWRAYDMCYNNGLVTLFIEAGKYMQDLILVAQKQDKYIFSTEWLDLIYKETTKFIKRADTVRDEYNRHNPTKSTSYKALSKRQLAVLQAVAQGLTREEIALKQDISVNTVKSAISKIYAKLGANNKGDAVSIAIKHGHIEEYTY